MASSSSVAQTFGDTAKERLLSGNGGAEAHSAGESRNGCCGWVSGSMARLCGEFHSLMASLYGMGRADPRKVIFAVKVGFALALVAMLIFWEPIENVSRYSIWAILTVVVVFEFSVGATLSKGFNRGIGTFSAGVLALGIGEIAVRSGGFEEVILTASIFWAGFFASYTKLSPLLKSYEYGFRIFLLTFSLVLITGNTSSSFYKTAFYRLLLIAIGASIALTVNIFIFPIWAGEDLHKLVVKNIRGVATSVDGCVSRYRHCLRRKTIPATILTFQDDDDPVYAGYREAIQSYSKEESLLECARWEPPHGPYRMFKYPWKHYVNVAGALRHCTFTVMAMHGCILSEIQAPLDKRQVFSREFQKVGEAGAAVLRELGDRLEKMEKLYSGDILQDVHLAAEELQMKIDLNSNLLINIHRCGEGKQGTHMEHQKIFSSLSEMGFPTVQEEPTDEEKFIQGKEQTARPRSTIITIDRSESRSNLMAGISPAAGTGTQWPSLHSITVSFQEAVTAESASALSLATFASLLIEFVARLRTVVDSYQELSKVAHFKDPGVNYEENVNCWKRVQAFFQFKN